MAGTTYLCYYMAERGSTELGVPSHVRIVGYLVSVSPCNNLAGSFELLGATIRLLGC
jgi:hypothetical protein